MANVTGYIINSTVLFTALKLSYVASSPIHVAHVGTGFINIPTTVFNSIKSGYVIPKPAVIPPPNHILGLKISAVGLFNAIKLSPSSNRSAIARHHFEGQKINRRLKLIKG